MIRPATAADWGDIWAILSPVFAAGRTYAYPRDIDEAAARAIWMDKPAATFVGVDWGVSSRDRPSHQRRCAPGSWPATIGGVRLA